MSTDANQGARVPADSEMEEAWVASYRDASWVVDGEIDEKTATDARAEFRAWLAARDAAVEQRMAADYGLRSVDDVRAEGWDAAMEALRPEYPDAVRTLERRRPGA